MCQVELILTLLIFLLVVLLKRIFIHLKVVGRNLFILKKKNVSVRSKIACCFKPTQHIL